jgi:hypothetical protein
MIRFLILVLGIDSIILLIRNKKNKSDKNIREGIRYFSSFANLSSSILNFIENKYIPSQSSTEYDPGTVSVYNSVEAGSLRSG